MGIGIGDDGDPGFPLSLAKPFVAAEEESPVANNRSPDGGPELIALEFRQPRVVRFALLVKALGPLNTSEFRQLPSKKPLKRFPDLLRRQTPG